MKQRSPYAAITSLRVRKQGTIASKPKRLPKKFKRFKPLKDRSRSND